MQRRLASHGLALTYEEIKATRIKSHHHPTAQAVKTTSVSDARLYQLRQDHDGTEVNEQEERDRDRVLLLAA